jgi:hypothetical protein
MNLRFSGEFAYQLRLMLAIGVAIRIEGVMEPDEG